MKLYQRPLNTPSQTSSLAEPEVEIIDEASWVIGNRNLAVFVAFRSVPGYPSFVAIAIATSLILILGPCVTALVFSSAIRLENSLSGVLILSSVLFATFMFLLCVPLVDRLLRRAITRRDLQHFGESYNTPIMGAGFSDRLIAFLEGPMDRGTYSLSSTSLEFRGYASNVRLPLHMIEKVSVVPGSTLYPAVVRIEYRFPDGASGVMHLENYLVGFGRRATESAKKLAHEIESARAQALTSEPFPIYPIFIPGKRLLAVQMEVIPKQKLRRIWIKSIVVSVASYFVIKITLLIISVVMHSEINNSLHPYLTSLVYLMLLFTVARLTRKEIRRRDLTDQQELLCAETKSAGTTDDRTLLTSESE